jgi:hypothetical protein
MITFRVMNFRNIDDSGPIPVERVTSFVGRNESGKTALLKALHKFNPAVEEPYNPQREFPRDRFTREFRVGGDWPVCEIEFALSEEFRGKLRNSLGTEIPNRCTCTRYYDGSLLIAYDTAVSDDPVTGAELASALDSFSKSIRRLKSGDATAEAQLQAMRVRLIEWATKQKDAAGKVPDLKNPAGTELLKKVRTEANAGSAPESADAVEALVEQLGSLIARADQEPVSDRLDESIEGALPIFIYFENYGILDSAIYLPRFLEDLARTPNDPRVRTINAMFKHVKLTAQEIATLGKEDAAQLRAAGQPITDKAIATDQQRKELRSVKLNSASLDITGRFSEWFRQRRHHIRYEADGDYFRIWVSDERRPGVDIELESRSKGFQWFFSFYLVFLVESSEGHRDAVLLLDEPGINLHPTAQQELIGFFETLAVNNPLIYTTHSPFLIDGTHIHRARPVTEDDSGHSRVSIGEWPKDRETIFPLQAAAGYAMVRGLFLHRDNILVEGMADYLYFSILSLLCRAAKRVALTENVYITPCGGTKMVGHLASLFLGQAVRPLVVLDGDDAARVRQNALLKDLYSGHERAVLMLSEVFGTEQFEIEDLIGEVTVVAHLNKLIGVELKLTKADRAKGSLPDQIKSAAASAGVSLPDGWKAEVARNIATAWSTTPIENLPEGVLARAEKLFKAINERFPELKT